MVRNNIGEKLLKYINGKTNWLANVLQWNWLTGNVIERKIKERRKKKGQQLLIVSRKEARGLYESTNRETWNRVI